MATLKLKSMFRGVLLLGLFLVMTLPGRSTTIEKESLESIVRRAHIIVWGSVVELQPSVKFEQLGLLRAKIQVLQAIKGKNVDDLLWAEGCRNRSEPENFQTLGLAKFQVGEQVIVCSVEDHGYYE